MTVAGEQADEAGRSRAGRPAASRLLRTASRAVLQPVSRALRRPAGPLAAVAALYGVTQLWFVGPGLRWGWDELVYLSQVSPSLPDAAFTAPRARGITWLAAPAAAFSPSPQVVRPWMTLLSSAGLFLAYLPWLRVLRHRGRSWTVALAALLLAGLWVAQYYGGAVMPNLYVAYGSVAATAFLLLALRDRALPGAALAGAALADPPRRGVLAGLAFSVAAVAVLRPGDAAWLVLGFVVAVLVLREGRRGAVAGPDPQALSGRRRAFAATGLAMAGGLGAGLAPWVVEAFLWHGGPLHRLQEAARIQGRLRPTWGVVHEFAALNGPLLCRPCTTPIRYPHLGIWWLALPFAVAGGLLAARRLGVARPYGVACAAGAALAAQYLFLVGYGAPRFLLPAYALLALPVALLLVRLASSGRVAAALVVLAVTGQLVTQHLVLGRRVERSVAYRAGERVVAETLRKAGLRPPCVVGGPAGTLPIAYEAGCAYRTVRATSPARLGGAVAAYVTHEQETRAAGRVPRRLLTPEGRVWYLWLPAAGAGEEMRTARPRPRGFAGAVPRVGFEPTLYGF